MRTVLIGLLLVSVTSHAEVLDSTAHGFTSQHELVLAATPAAAYTALTEGLHLWWDAEHSYAGQARGFSVDASAGGCFCESLGDAGSVEHMRVVNVQVGKSLTMQGGLGPLQGMGVAGSMSFVFQPHESGSLLTYRYVVGGYHAGGLDSLAIPVDQVQLGQLQRLQKYLSSGMPLNQ
jgi:hypothetical protein